MELNIENFKKLIVDGIFNGNQRRCAIAMEITPAFLNKILRNTSMAGAKFFGKLKKFCDTNKLEFDRFIFLK